MRESNTHAINVTIKLVIKVISRHIKYQYIWESISDVINVTMKLVMKVISIDLKCQYMMEI